MRTLLTILAAVLALSLGGCGYNTFQTTDEQVKASWAEVINQYQRRADLVPNLVNTVKGEANFEQSTLTQVIEARSRALASAWRAQVFSASRNPSTPGSRMPWKSCVARAPSSSIP